MRKRTVFLIVLIVASLGVLVAYAFMEDWRPAIGNTFGSARDFAVGQFTAFSAWFQTLPYWPAIGIGLGVLGGIAIDRYAQDVWHGMQRWGYSKTTQPLTGLPPLQQAPANTLPQQIYPNPDVQQATPQLPLEEPPQ